MTYEEKLKTFLKNVDKIKKEKPTYRQPGDGSDGTCDCIGLVIGALKRMGIKWPGIHGTNYTVRRALVSLNKINSISDLKVGDIVFKARDKSHSKYNLPSRYKKGGAYYNGDLLDYYHVGVVTSKNPLNITHMTSPTVKVDTKLGNWSYYGMLTLLAGDTKTPAPVSGEPAESNLEGIVSSGGTAVVWAQSGRYVKMRQQPSTSCRLYEEVPIGARVTLVEPGETWAKINYGRRKGWYMMAKYLLVEKE